MTNANSRTADYPIDPMFLERWSPRAFTGEPISETDLLTMLEAARWAASSYNSQPWRFIYARRDTPHWDRFLDLLVPHNQSWVKKCVRARHPGFQLIDAIAGNGQGCAFAYPLL